MANENKKLDYANVTVNLVEYKKKGVGKKGEWKLYGIKATEIENNKSRWYSCFETEKLKPADLIAGADYCFGYTEAPNPKNADFPYRTLVWVGEVNVDDVFGPDEKPMLLKPKVKTVVPTVDEQDAIDFINKNGSADDKFNLADPNNRGKALYDLMTENGYATTEERCKVLYKYIKL